MKKKYLSAALILCMTTALFPGTALAKSRSSQSGNPSTPAEKRSELEIWDYFYTHPFDVNKRDTWTAAADASQGEAGKLSEETVAEALNTLNFIRYIAGIPAVTVSQTYEARAQAGAALLDYMGEGLTHYPQKPDGVTQQFFDKAYEGTSHSNLSYSSFGYLNLSASVIKGWMSDADVSNIDRVGHRRWCLDPDMTQVGFGESGEYAALYVVGDDYVYHSDYTYVPWPAQVMPIEYFYGPWSVSLNADAYTATENTKVTLLSSMTGQQYVLDSSCTDKSGVYFNVNNTGYGLGPAVIFEPNVYFAPGDEVFVNIEGLKDKNSRDTSIQYSVRFFSMAPIKVQEENPIVFEGTWDSQKNNIYLRTGANNQFVKNQWACIDGNWYCFDAKGIMAKGLRNIDGEWYYFGADGVRVSGWLFAGSQWYYFAPDGKMYRSATTPDGYEINENGAWVVNGVVQTK